MNKPTERAIPLHYLSATLTKRRRSVQRGTFPGITVTYCRQPIAQIESVTNRKLCREIAAKINWVDLTYHAKDKQPHPLASLLSEHSTIVVLFQRVPRLLIRAVQQQEGT